MDDERERDIAARILDTANELEHLLQGKKGPLPEASGDPGRNAFWDAVGQLEAILQARAGLLAELIELVLPEVPRTARPLRASLQVSDPARARALEALAGSVPARVRELPWLDTPAVSLVGDKLSSAAFQARPDDSGVIQGREFFLRVDGVLVLLESLGTWRIVERRLQVDAILVQARELAPDALLRELTDFDLLSVLVSLRGLLHPPVPRTDAPPAPDLPERQARFAGLMQGLGEAMAEHVTHLRRVGDSPA